jgi:hypothetical protein
MTTAMSLTDLRTAIARMGASVTLSADLPGLTTLVDGWEDVLHAKQFVLGTATIPAADDPSKPLIISGTAKLFDTTSSLTVTVYQLGDGDDAGPECVIAWSQPFESWSPADVYLDPATSQHPDKRFQMLLRKIALQQAELFYSSADLSRSAPAAMACGALPSWLDGPPLDGLTMRGTLQLPDEIRGVLESLIGPLAVLAVDAVVRMESGALVITLQHGFDGASRPTLALFGADGPAAALSRIDLAFPINGAVSALPIATLHAALTEDGAEVDLTVTIDLLGRTATLDARGVAGKAPSLAWFARTAGIATPDLPFDLGHLTLTKLAGTFDLARRTLSRFKATISTEKPLTVLDGTLCFSPDLIVAHDAAATPPLDVSLTGVCTRGQSRLDVVIDPTDGKVTAALQPGSSVDLYSLLGSDVLPHWLTTDLAITDFDLTGNVKTGDFQVALKTTGTISLTIEGESFGVGNVDIIAQHQDKAFAVTAHGTLAICGAQARVALDAGATTTASFTLPEINLADLAKVFLRQIGKPEELGSFTLTSVDVTLSLPGHQFTLNADITDPIPIAGSSSWALEHASFAASRDAQGVHAAIQGTIALAGQRIDLAGQYLGNGAGWLLTGKTPQTQTIGLGTLVGEIAERLGTPVPADLVSAIGAIAINKLDVAVNTHDKSFQCLGEVTTKGTVPLGNRAYEIDLKAHVASTVDATGKRSFAGHLKGDLTIGNAVFAVSFDFGAGRIIRAEWRETGGSALSFTDIADALHIPHHITVPKQLDLGLKAAAFEYHAASSTFMLSAESSILGDAFFTASKDSSGRLGFVFGVDLPHDMQLSNLPGIGTELEPADFLTITQGAVLLSSARFPSYQLPQLPALPPAAAASAFWTPRPTGRSIKPMATGATLQLTQGLSLAAIVDFAATNDVRAQNLRAITRRDQLLLQIAIGPGGLTLIGAMPGSAAIDSGKSRLTLTQPAVRIDIGIEVTFQLSGGIAFTVNKTPITATARLMINESEAQVAIEIAGQQQPLPPPPGIKGLHIASFGVVMGVYFAPPGLDLGLTGNFTIGNVQTLADDKFGIVLEVIEEAANILYLAFDMDQLDLGTALTLFTDRNDPALVRDLNIVKASDLAFHWCDSVVTLPDGSVVPPGFGFSASLDVLGFGAHADLEVSIADGIHGQAQLAPFALKDVLKVAGDDQGLTRVYEEINGSWQQVTNTSVTRQLPPLPRRTETIVAAGGPIIQFNCKQAPFIQCGMNVDLFEAHAAVMADAEPSGFAFGLDFEPAGIDKFTLNCTLQDSDHFSASADLKMLIKADIGPIHVKGADVGRLHLTTTFGGHLAISLDPSRFELALGGSFDINGVSCQPPQLRLESAPAKLAELPQSLIALIAANADDIFKGLLEDGARWAGLVKGGVITGAGDVATTLKNTYHMTGDQARQAMQKAGYAANDAAGAIQRAYGTVADTIKDKGQQAIDSVAHEGHHAVHSAEKTGDEVRDKLRHLF